MLLNTREKLIVFMKKYKLKEKDLAAMLDYSAIHFYAVLSGRKPITQKMQQHINKLFKEYNFDKDPEENDSWRVKQVKEALYSAYNLAKLFYVDDDYNMEEINGFIIGYNAHRNETNTDDNSSYQDIKNRAVEKLEHIFKVANVSEDFRRGFIKGYCICNK